VEAEVHITVQYLQLCKHWFTMENILLKGGHEIDILALDPISGDKFHLEVRIATGKGFKVRMKDTSTHDGRWHRRGLDTLDRVKFSPPEVIKACTDIFGSSDYRKVLVVHAVEDPSVIQQAKKIYGIEIWLISDLITQVAQRIGSSSYRDDVLRLLQLVSLTN
jgi:hypothetical protein